MKQFIWAALAVMVLAGCGKADIDATEVLTIKEGKHAADNYRATWNDCRYFYYEWELDASMMYELGDNDQCDWNKLGGHSFRQFGNHKYSIMAAWRYDRSGNVLISPYYHDEGLTYWAGAPCTDLNGEIIPSEGIDPALGFITALIGDVIETHMNFNYDNDWAAVTIINQNNGQVTYFEHVFGGDIRKQREIWPWFGGNEEAPHDILFYRTLKGVE